MGLPDQGQRDRAIERLLRSGAGTGADPGAGAICVNGETLAAWSSGALAQTDAARVEEHLADCARCQAMLAAFARVEPIAVAPVPLWRRTQMRWLVPLATAATVAAIWVAVPQRNEPAPFVAESTEAVVAAPPAAAPRAAQTKPAPSEPSTLTLRDQTAASARTQTQAAQRSRETDAVQQRKEEESRLAAAGAGTQAAADSLQRMDRRGVESPAAAAPAAPAAPPAAGAVAETVAVAPETRQMLARNAIPEILSPGGATRWRIVGGQLQRSTDEGKSWESVALPSPAALAAGHAPSGSIAWFVGRAGAVFVTTDGVRLERVPFPQAVDIVAILAVDDRQATVTTIDGRVFGTSDRGVTWIQP
jgi:hypothetical protein